MSDVTSVLEASFGTVAMGGVPAARPPLAGGATRGDGFAAFVRSGDTVEVKAMSGASGGAGGYAEVSEAVACDWFGSTGCGGAGPDGAGSTGSIRRWSRRSRPIASPWKGMAAAR
ncbi:MAG TPA: hypothetical protein VNR91_04855 [Sphingomonas sp.]|nr:hypothetical protein [Sphingomonas sp.]